MQWFLVLMPLPRSAKVRYNFQSAYRAGLWVRSL